MAFLTLCNIPMNIDAKSGERRWTEVGDKGRAFDGSFRRTLQKLKRSWPMSSAPLIAADADALAGLVQGLGHSWSFDVDLYSSKGLAKKSQSGTVTAGVSTGTLKFGNKLQIAAGGQVTWGVGLTGEYTLTVWRLEGGAFQHYVIRKKGIANPTINKWKNGISDDGAATGWLTVNGSGDVVLGDLTNADDFDDLVALPFATPNSWVSSLYSSTRAFPKLPKLEAAGTALSSPETPVTVFGVVERESPEPFPSGGTWQQGGRRVDFVLEEA